MSPRRKNKRKPKQEEPGTAEPQLPTRDRYTLRLRLTLASNKRAIGSAVRKVVKVASEVGCFEDALADVEIALREALANAIIHGNKQRRNKKVSLRCYGAPDLGILIAVRDEGEGFDPETLPDPRGGERLFLHHGRGVFLMRELMDHLEHRKGGREVVMYKSTADGGPDGEEDGGGD